MTTAIPPGVEVMAPTLFDRAVMAEHGHKLLGALGGSRFIRQNKVEVYDRLLGISIKTGDWWRNEPSHVEITRNPDGTYRVKAFKVTADLKHELVSFEASVLIEHLHDAWVRVMGLQ